MKVPDPLSTGGFGLGQADGLPTVSVVYGERGVYSEGSFRGVSCAMMKKDRGAFIRQSALAFATILREYETETGTRIATVTFPEDADAADAVVAAAAGRNHCDGQGFLTPLGARRVAGGRAPPPGGGPPPGPQGGPQPPAPPGGDGAGGRRQPGKMMSKTFGVVIRALTSKAVGSSHEGKS